MLRQAGLLKSEDSAKPAGRLGSRMIQECAMRLFPHWQSLPAGRAVNVSARSTSELVVVVGRSFAKKLIPRFARNAVGDLGDGLGDHRSSPFFRVERWATCRKH